MPRNVRNFWIETRTFKNGEWDDWRDVATGPLGARGTFTTSIKIRDAKGVRDVLNVEGYADEDGTLSLIVFADGENVYKVKTHRDRALVEDNAEGPSFSLCDDGTLDTVLECDACGEDMRYDSTSLLDGFDGIEGSDAATTYRHDAAHALAEAEHECDNAS